MSVYKQITNYLRSYSASTQAYGLWFLFQTRSVFYLIVIWYTLLVTFIFPEIKDGLQPVKLQEFIFGEHIRKVVGLTVLLWPLMEELLFRAGIKRWGRNVSWLLWAVLFFIVRYFLGSTIDSLWLDQISRSLLGYLIYLGCVVLCFHAFKPLFSKLSRLYARRPWWIFWLSTLCFWLVHLSNFNLDQWNWIMLLLIVPQILLWIMLWFVRVKRWLTYSIVLHMFHNLIQIIPIIILKQLSGPWKDVLSYIPNMKPEDLSWNPWFYMSALYGILLMLFVWYNLKNEISALYTK